MFARIGRISVLAAAFFFPTSAVVEARPVHKRALADYFGPFLAKKLNDCRTCHLPDQPGETTSDLPLEKPHNRFGARLKAVKKELEKAGKKTTIAARMEAIADEDSDGDGVPNLIELLSGHYPGDANDKPTPAEIAEADKTLLLFRKAKSAYPWTPFETVKRPSVPPVKNGDWGRNPIDAFIAAEHEQRGLKPRPEAGKAVLLRRVYLDLTGLPPSPEELHAFLADSSAEAYDKVVDRLLASPRYGERWGRHWMDIWRYSDWAGYGAQVRDSQPHIWHWRDWIIESLNQDKGYDRMILEMLAADELTPLDSNALRATGYLVRNFKLLSRENWLQDTVDHTAQAFLGVTLGCARCHDHMYDPILQKEYYQVRAIFEPHQVRIDRLPGQPDVAKDGLPRVYDADPQVQTFLFLRGDDRTPDKTPLPAGVPESLGGKFPEVQPVNLPRTASVPDKRDFVVRELLARSAADAERVESAREIARRKGGLELLQARLDDHPLRAVTKLAGVSRALRVLALVEAEVAWLRLRNAALAAELQTESLEDAGKKDTPEWVKVATETTTLQRHAAFFEARRKLLGAQGWPDVHSPESQAEDRRRIIEAEKTLAKAEADLKLPPSMTYTKRPMSTYPATSTGRRLAFARWIADRENPLTARVAMNHIWLRHFGQAIVPSVYDFGRNGRPPAHPALLDWLAAEFMDRGWSMKAMHRLIVTSNTYRMASTPDAANLANDRDNQYFWRMPSRRLEAEVVRDCVFYVAGKLDFTMGGPDIEQTQGLTVPRRSLYFRHAVEKQMEFLKIFDSASVTECYQRKESIMPQQALALANSELTHRQSRLLARDLVAKVGADPACFTKAAFERVLSHPPTGQELAECVTFLQLRSQRYMESKTGPPGIAEGEGRIPSPAAAQRARENLVHVLLNMHDFVTVH